MQSRAGLSAKPVVPPSVWPMTMINSPTINGFKPVVKSPKLSKIKIKKKVAIHSLKKLKKGLAIAGPVAKIPTELPCSFEVALN